MRMPVFQTYFVWQFPYVEYTKKFKMEKRNLKQEALGHIHNMLLCGQLKWGERVSEETIAKRIGISRTPVREALHLYCEMGVFKRLPRFDTVVRVPEAREIEELFEIRTALEVYAVAEAIKYITSEELERIGAAIARLKALAENLRKSRSKHLTQEHTAELFIADQDFHMGIIRATGNRMLIKHINDNRMLTRILGNFRTSRFTEGNVADIYNQHNAIYEAIAKKNVERASTLLREHLRESKRGTVTDIKKELDRMQEDNMLNATPSFRGY